jgi:hypothetical protein
MNIFTKTKTKKALASVVGLTVGLTMTVGTASAQTIEQLQAQIAELTALVAQLTAAQAGGSTTTGGTCTGYVFSTNLKQGDSNMDVMNLQKVLNANGFTVATTGAGSAGNETEYFGSMTKAAVIEFQEANAAAVLTPVGLTAGTGYVGPSTRNALNALAVCDTDYTTGGTTTGGGTTATGPVTVALNAASPMSGGLVGLQAAAPLAVFDFSGVGTVTSVSLKRSGFSNQDALTAVYLYDGTTRLTDGYTFNNAGDLVMNNLNLGVNGTRTITVRGDVVSSPVSTQSTIAVSMVSYTADGTVTPVNVQGGMLTFVAGSLAGITIGGTNTAVAASVDAGTTNYTVWGDTITVSTRSVAVTGALFKMIGSAPASALSNVTLVVDGADVATGAVGADGMIAFDASANPLTLTTGSHTVEVRADIVDGAARSFYVSLQKAGDIMLVDSVYNAHVSINPFSTQDGGTISIGQGTLSLTRDTSMSTDVTSSASNQTIGMYKLQAYGEDVKVMQVDVTLTETGDAGLQDVTLYADGAQVGATQDLGTAAGATTLNFTLGSQLIVPAGTTVVLEVRANMLTAANTSFTGTIVTDVAVASAQGMSSYETATAGSPGTFTVTAGSASATVSKSLAYTDQTIGRNVSAVKIGSYVIEAGSTEDIRVTNLNVAFTNAAGTATTGAVEVTDIANLKISLDGGATFRPSVNPTLTSNNFPVNVTVPASGSLTVDVYVDVTAASDTETLTTTVYATARGASSNIALTSTGFASGSPVTGQTMTVGEGALSALTVITSSNTAAQYVVGPSTGVELIRYNVTASGGPTTITDITFDVTGTAAGAMTKLTVTGNQGGSACSKAVTGNTVSLTGCDIPVPLGFGGTDLVVTADFGTVGFNAVASESIAWADIRDITHNNGIEDVTVNVDGSGSPDLSDVASSSIMTLVASKPTLTLVTSTEKLSAGEVKVGSVTVAAGTNGNIKLNTLPVTITVSGGAVLASTSASNFVLKEGNTTITATNTVTGSTASAQVDMAISDNVVITAGNSRTFDVYATFATVTGGDDSASMSVLPAANLDWDDVQGGGTNLTGTLLKDYPTGSVTIVD